MRAQNETDKHGRHDPGVDVNADVKAKKKKAKGGGVFPKRIPYVILVLLMGVAAIALFCVMLLVNIFPQDLSLIIIAVVMVLLIVTSILLARRRRWKRLLGIVIGVIFIVICGAVSYYLGTAYATMNKISEMSNESNAEIGRGASIDPTTEPFNLYVTGIDRWAGEQDLDRSDVNMIMTINPVTKKILLTSIPRDTYVKLHTAQQMDKLTHTGIYGVDETINTVEDWLNIDLNYYLKLNFSSMRGIINAIGGIDVYSPVAFDSDISECSYVKGWNHLNGKQALYFARERHAFEGQDSVRVENQQRVVKAIIKKMTTSPAVLLKYGEIMEVAGSNLSTNMSYDEIQDIVKMQMTDLASWDVETQKVEGEYDMDYVASLSHKNKYSVYRADAASVKKCLDAIYDVTHPTSAELEEAEKIKRRGFIDSIIKNARDRVENGK